MQNFSEGCGGPFTCNSCHLFPVECYYQTELSYPHYRVPICLYICIYIINIMYHYSIIGCFRNKFLCNLDYNSQERKKRNCFLVYNFSNDDVLVCKQIYKSIASHTSLETDRGFPTIIL